MTRNVKAARHRGIFATAPCRQLTFWAAFHVEIVTDGWVVRLMTRFDGSHTAAEVYGGARADQEVPDQFQEGEFVDLVCFLPERGLLTLSRREDNANGC